jgi:hypothetical protein
MKRKRETEVDEDEIIKEVNKKFKEINQKIKQNSTERGKEKMKIEQNSHEIFVKKTFLNSIEMNQMKIFKLICDEYPSHIPPHCLSIVSNLEVGMMDYLFVKKLVPKDARNRLEEDVLMYWVKNSNLKIVQYLIDVQKFDLTTSLTHGSFTGFLFTQ